MKDIIKGIGIMVGMILATYLLFAVILPLAFATGEVIYYRASRWSCNTRGGNYLQIKNDKNYRYFDCVFNN